MPDFTYVARDRAGVRVSGVLAGGDGRDIASRLAEDGLTPVRIELAAGQAFLAEHQRGTGLFTAQVPAIEILMFCRQMHTLLRAGVPILRALAGLVESCHNKRFKSVLADVREGLESGRELSQALAIHEKVFSSYMIAMIRVGESSGQLDEIFARLFAHFSFQKFMREQVKTALRYPVFVILAMVIAIVIINIWVIPAFAKAFTGFGAELPVMTRILIASSNFMVQWWPAMLVGTVAAAFLARGFVRTEAGAFAWDKLKLRIPLAGNILRLAAFSRFCRAMALSLKSGVGIVQALTLVQPVVENLYMASHIEQIRLSVARGESVLRAAAATGIFTPTVMQMIMVGEESGMLDEMFTEVADLYQNDVEYALKTLSAQIEPILILILGAMVLVLALGIFLPMWELGSAMKGK